VEGLIQTRVVDFFVLYIGYFHKLTPRPRGDPCTGAAQCTRREIVIFCALDNRTGEKFSLIDLTCEWWSIGRVTTLIWQPLLVTAWVWARCKYPMEVKVLIRPRIWITISLGTRRSVSTYQWRLRVRTKLGKWPGGCDPPPLLSGPERRMYDPMWDDLGCWDITMDFSGGRIGSSATTW